jgi:hypothetical protein
MVVLYFFWVIFLFLFTFAIGIVAPLAGVGGGVVFVPLVTAFSPFNIDYIRGVGIIVALTSALSSVPTTMSRGLASLKIVAPLAILANVTAILGSSFGIVVSNVFPAGKYYIILALGVLLFIVLAVMTFSQRVEFPEVEKVDVISRKLGLRGSWYEPSLDEEVEYVSTNFHLALPLFGIIGFMAGMFGLGAGWASVPILNLIMGLPIRVAVSTSMLLISINASAAAWVYIAKGAVLSILVVPSILGMTLGSRISALLVLKVRPRTIRLAVMGIIFIAGILNIYKGLVGIYGGG